MENILKVGCDSGNDALKIWTKAQKPMRIPMVYSYHMGETTELMDLDDIEVDKLEDNIDVTINSKALSQNNIRYIAGNKVLNDNLTAIELEKKSDKSKDEIPVIVTLSGLALLAIKENPDKDNIDMVTDISVALPVNTITKESANNNAKRYIGNHEVIFHHPSGRDVIVNIKIEYSKCLPEGAAAAWGVVFDENGDLIKRKVEINENIIEIDFENKTMLHFDIGSGTTEMVVTEGVKFNPKLSEGLGYGVKDTVLEIMKRWNRENSRKTIDSIAEFNEIYFDTEHPRHSKLREISKTGLLQLANKMSQSIINKIDDFKDEPYTFIYGGGAELIKEHLEDILEKKDRMKNVIFLENSIFVNARGLLVYTSSPRYQEQKEQYLGKENLTSVV